MPERLTPEANSGSAEAPRKRSFLKSSLARKLTMGAGLAASAMGLAGCGRETKPEELRGTSERMSRAISAPPEVKERYGKAKQESEEADRKLQKAEAELGRRRSTGASAGDIESAEKEVAKAKGVAKSKKEAMDRAGDKLGYGDKAAAAAQGLMASAKKSIAEREAARATLKAEFKHQGGDIRDLPTVDEATARANSAAANAYELDPNRKAVGFRIRGSRGWTMWLNAPEGAHRIGVEGLDRPVDMEFRYSNGQIIPVHWEPGLKIDLAGRIPKGAVTTGVRLRATPATDGMEFRVEYEYPPR
ncbi:MAG: hypothetical protein HY978_03710 [Candidatus Liptonbacteria bacterium]|nr:hypothetical protein [Candidatus Liptonbacteria bacterium]